MKSNELSGERLDYWTARAKGIQTFRSGQDNALYYIAVESLPPRKWAPSHFWSQGGPIIEEQKIELNWEWEGDGEWTATLAPDTNAQGGTVLEAAMRAFVINKLGESVPDTLE